MGDEQKETDILVGVKIKPDGTVDTSSAARMHMTDDERAAYEQASKDIRQQRQDEKTRKLKDLEGAPDGTAIAVLYRLRKAAVINDSHLEKAPNDTRAKQRKYELSIADEIIQRLQDAYEVPDEAGKKPLTYEQRLAARDTMPAAAASEALEDLIITWSQTSTGNPNAHIPFRGKQYPVTDVLRASSKVQSQLIDEATRTPQV